MKQTAKQQPNESLDWWCSLTIHQQIGLKEFYPLICGVGFQEIGFIVPLRTRIMLIYEKLILGI